MGQCQKSILVPCISQLGGKQYVKKKQIQQTPSWIQPKANSALDEIYDVKAAWWALRESHFKTSMRSKIVLKLVSSNKYGSPNEKSEKSYFYSFILFL